ncbi:hypothetical protein E2C01_063875 [Portunus trituberculatus]|uniref:Uncharacterized protein n=1 Tax=Portunus trituberculatus TaxID=210409 RepID=A0A5B7HJD0_PORTR|nr:hypothetical protein [Portunus trituberculatus]
MQEMWRVSGGASRPACSPAPPSSTIPAATTPSAPPCPCTSTPPPPSTP